MGSSRHVVLRPPWERSPFVRWWCITINQQHINAETLVWLSWTNEIVAVGHNRAFYTTRLFRNFGMSYSTLQHFVWCTTFTQLCVPATLSSSRNVRLLNTQGMFNGYLKSPVSHAICYDLVDFWRWKMKQSHFQILHMEGFEGGEITVWSYAHFFKVFM